MYFLLGVAFPSSYILNRLLHDFGYCFTLLAYELILFVMYAKGTHVSLTHNSFKTVLQTAFEVEMPISNALVALAIFSIILFVPVLTLRIVQDSIDANWRSFCDDTFFVIFGAFVLFLNCGFIINCATILVKKYKELKSFKAACASIKMVI